jgi:hypothetical protein
MKIDLPITIIFDCQDYQSGHGFQVRNFIPRVCTLRFDVDDDSAPVELISFYPPEDAPGQVTTESGEGILAMLSQDGYRRITARAKRNPYNYAVGTEAERIAMQEEADEEAAQNGQFGAGA